MSCLQEVWKWRERLAEIGDCRRGSALARGVIAIGEEQREHAGEEATTAAPDTQAYTSTDIHTT